MGNWCAGPEGSSATSGAGEGRSHVAVCCSARRRETLSIFVCQRRISMTINNTSPTLSGLGDTAAYTENGAAVVLDVNGDAAVSDAELNNFPSFAGATLTLARHSGANADDVFSGNGTAAGKLDLTHSNGLGENVSLDGGASFIGTFSQPGDGTLTVTFNSNASHANVNAVLEQISYANASDNPPASITIDFTFNDGNGLPGGQDQGSGPGSTTASVTVNTTATNDAPLLINVAP